MSGRYFERKRLVRPAKATQNLDSHAQPKESCSPAPSRPHHCSPTSPSLLHSQLLPSHWAARSDRVLKSSAAQSPVLFAQTHARQTARRMVGARRGAIRAAEGRAVEAVGWLAVLAAS